MTSSACSTSSPCHGQNGVGVLLLELLARALYSLLQDRTPPLRRGVLSSRWRKIVYEPPTTRRIKTKNLCHAVVVVLCSDGGHDRNAQVSATENLPCLPSGRNPSRRDAGQARLSMYPMRYDDKHPQAKEQKHITLVLSAVTSIADAGVVGLSAKCQKRYASGPLRSGWSVAWALNRYQ
jgi:hypothetical protein